jgi:8-hydroxy-5-deazaflavin:NADPH oxidoreductase
VLAAPDCFEPGGKLLLDNELCYEEVLVKIGIIGAGNIGATLTRRLTALGHQVAVANSRDPETLSELAGETGATAVSAAEVANGADVVIVTIPQKAIPLLPEGILAGAAAGAAIVDTGNYYPARDGQIEPIESGMTESRWVSEQLGRPVVKAFNTIRAQHLLELGKPAGTPGRIALPVAGDDPNSKRTVMELVDALGFDPIDAGTIDESWRQQPGKPVYAADLDAAGVTRALAEAGPD